MREYYARYFREVRRHVFIFWKAQIAVGLGAGVVTAIVNRIRQETPWVVGFLSVGFIAIGYLVMLGIAFIYSAMRAPVTLDRERANANLFIGYSMRIVQAMKHCSQRDLRAT